MSDQLDGQPIDCELCGGPLDGDCFTLAPNGSVMPPTRLNYPTDIQLGGQLVGVWLVYQTMDLASWESTKIIYKFLGRETLEDRIWIPA